MGALRYALRLGVAAALAAAPVAGAAQAVRTAPTDFAAQVAALSEPAGYFDTDNLISNEASYLHPIPALRRLGAEGGAYIGVGPDQNFAYIAAIRPRVAYIVDIRRDNLLQHLLLRALFVQAPTRVEFLALLFGRRAPAAVGPWRGRSVDALADYIDRAPLDSSVLAERRPRLLATLRGFGVPLTAADLETIERFHLEFVRAGTALRFTTFGRDPQWYYPTYRQLITERDRSGRQSSFLGSEDSYRLLRTMQRQGRIVPVVGDLSGSAALRRIGDRVRAQGLVVSAFYTSNVEFYLNGPGQFARYAANVAALPRGPRSLIIRSYFPGRWGRHPRAVEGYHTTQLLQRMNDFVVGTSRGEFPTYWDLVTRRLVE